MASPASRMTSPARQSGSSASCTAVGEARFQELLRELQQEHSRVVQELEVQLRGLGQQQQDGGASGQTCSPATLSFLAVPGNASPSLRSMPPNAGSPTNESEHSNQNLLTPAGSSPWPTAAWPTAGSPNRKTSDDYDSLMPLPSLLGAAGPGTCNPYSAVDESGDAADEDDAKSNEEPAFVSTMSEAVKTSSQSVAHVKRMLRKMSTGTLSSCSMTATSSDGHGSEKAKEEERKSWPVLKRVYTRAKEALVTQESTVFSTTTTLQRNQTGLMTRLVTSPFFELAFAVLVFISTLVLAVEAQYNGMQSSPTDVGRNVDEPVGAGDESRSGADTVFFGLEWFFGVLFTLELLLKLVVIRWDIFKDPWNLIDLVVVVFWFVEQIGRQLLPLDPKIVRVARLARLLRFLRIVKTIQAFDSLYLMMSSIRSSASALAWSIVIVLLGEMMFALFLNVVLEDFWTDEAQPDSARELIYDYFGTFTKALQTMIEMLLGNWFAITRMLTTHVSEWFMVFGIAHQLILGFAVVEVITGVFLHETFKVATMDDGILLNETKREVRDQTQKMQRFFEHADTDQKGFLTREKFRDILNKDKVQEWMNAMGLDTHDVDKVFWLFDADKNGQISLAELVAGTLSLKGQAKAMELAVVRAMVEDIHRAVKPARKTTDGPPGGLKRATSNSALLRSGSHSALPSRDNSRGNLLRSDSRVRPESEHDEQSWS